MLYERFKVNAGSAARSTVARFDDHADAQPAAGRPSDDGYPVRQPGIAGTDVMLAERVTGRPIELRAAAAGALSGLWAGLLTGILFGLFTTVSTWVAMLVAGLGLGVLCGASFWFAAHLAIRGQRDLSSLRGLAVRRHDLIAREGGAERTRSTRGQAGLLPPDTPAA